MKTATTRVQRHIARRQVQRAPHAVKPEDEAPLAVTRVVRLNHEGLPFSTSLLLVRMLDLIEVNGCAHCEDLHYALIAYIKGLRPLAGFVPDYLVKTPDKAKRSGTKAHLEAGVVV